MSLSSIVFGCFFFYEATRYKERLTYTHNYFIHSKSIVFGNYEALL